MGLRGYLVKRTVNTIILIVFVVVLNFVIFELMPGSQGSIQALVEGNPRIPADKKEAFVNAELARYGLSCGTDSGGHAIPCPIWDRFGKYFVAMITFNFG